MGISNIELTFKDGVEDLEMGGSVTHLDSLKTNAEIPTKHSKVFNTTTTNGKELKNGF